MTDSRQPTVWITGGSRGIGACIAEQFSTAGYQVVLMARDSDVLRATSTRLGAICEPLDLAQHDSLSTQIGEILIRHGCPDVLVNNAGIAHSASLIETTDEQWQRTMDVNLSANFVLCRAILPQMRKRGRGRVIFVASNAGLAGYPYTSAYCASKHGVIGLMRGLAREYTDADLTVNAICPGFVETEMAIASIQRIADKTGRSLDEARRSLEKMNPQKRLIQPEEVAALALFLCAEHARGIHGQAIAVDGGQVQH